MGDEARARVIRDERAERDKAAGLIVLPSRSRGFPGALINYAYSVIPSVIAD